jgi:hypothetical protein
MDTPSDRNSAGLIVTPAELPIVTTFFCIRIFYPPFAFLDGHLGGTAGGETNRGLNQRFPITGNGGIQCQQT